MPDKKNITKRGHKTGTQNRGWCIGNGGMHTLCCGCDGMTTIPIPTRLCSAGSFVASSRVNPHFVMVSALLATSTLSSSCIAVIDAMMRFFFLQATGLSTVAAECRRSGCHPVQAWSFHRSASNHPGETLRGARQYQQHWLCSGCRAPPKTGLQLLRR